MLDVGRALGLSVGQDPACPHPEKVSEISDQRWGQQLGTACQESLRPLRFTVYYSVLNFIEYLVIFDWEMQTEF